MSVDVNTYVMFGALLPYDAVSYEACEPYRDDNGLNPKGNVTVLYDGMCGKYVAVGHVIAKTDDYQHFDEPIKLPPWNPDLADDVREAIIEMGVPLPEGGPSWLVVSHYR